MGERSSTSRLRVTHSRFSACSLVMAMSANTVCYFCITMSSVLFTFSSSLVFAGDKTRPSKHSLALACGDSLWNLEVSRLGIGCHKTCVSATSRCCPDRIARASHIGSLFHTFLPY